MTRITTAAIAAVLLAASLALGADERPPADPVARKTWRAQRLQERRAAQQSSPQNAAFPARPMELRGPLPLPAQIAGGTPVGGACEPDKKDCQLELAPPSGQVLVVTALWSATRATCDAATLAGTPPNGAPIAPWWRCEQKLTVAGAGAGYTGYLIPR